MEQMETRMTTRIAVVGAGTMGSGIAQVAATAGNAVIVIDASEEALQRGIAGVDRSLETLAKRGRISVAEGKDIASRINWTTDFAGARRRSSNRGHR